MATNLITQLMNEFGGTTLNTFASALGETPARTQSALGGVVPALIGGLMNRASTTNQANDLLDVIKRNGFDTNTYSDATSALRVPGGVNGLINTGRPLLDYIFGARSGAITDFVSSASGIGRSSSSSLLSLAVPIVLGSIARRVMSSGWGASTLMNLLGSQREFMRDAPPGLASILFPEETRRYAETRDTYAAQPVRETVREYRAARSGGWLWTLPLLLLIPLLGYFLTHRGETTRVTRIERPAPRAVIPPARTTVPEPMRRMTEPEKQVGTTGMTGTTGKVEAPKVVTEAAGPYTLEFQTGSFRLTSNSAAELRKVVAYLKAHPAARADVNGYTDSAGNDAANIRLSEARANMTMHRIAGLGVAKARLTAKGYGASDPVADNATAEGRQQNRRVVIKVIEK